MSEKQKKVEEQNTTNGDATAAKKTKKCFKCQKEIDQKTTKCPFCNYDQFSAGKQIIGCLLIIIIIIAVAAAIIMPRCGTFHPPVMVDSSAPVETQKKQAEKLELDVYTISKQFIKKQYKLPESATFEPFDKNMVTWLNGNEFTCGMNVEFKNSSKAMSNSNFWTKVKYTGKNQWILLDIKLIK